METCFILSTVRPNHSSDINTNPDTVALKGFLNALTAKARHHKVKATISSGKQKTMKRKLVIQ